MTDTTFEMPESMSKERQEQEKLIAEYELRRKAKGVVVPTDDAKVRTMLRQLNEPITLFGEREMERRERLRRLMAALDIELAEMPAVGQIVLQQVGPAQTGKFYTEGTEQLKAARAAIAQWSLRRAAHRIALAKNRRDHETVRMEAGYMRKSALSQASNFVQQSSEIGDERPISGCQFSPDGGHLATCSWGGHLVCWSVGEGCKREWSVRAHTERVTGVAWHPLAHNNSGDAMQTDGPDSGASSGQHVALATASADKEAKLFSRTGQLLRTLKGHTDRLARLAFHPTGNYLGTASFDMTWRLWDVESGTCLLEQEGHSRAVYTVAFHPDGSLAGSAGLDAVGRLWDCRTGRSPLALEGHVKQILAMDFHPNGIHLVTGSDDHTCKVWDLRQKKCMYTIPAHTSLVSSCRYERGCDGAYLVTGGYDALVKVWSGRDYSLVKTLAGHEGKVMGVDVRSLNASGALAGSQHLLASVAYDRTLKLWSPEHVPDIEAADVHMEAV